MKSLWQKIQGDPVFMRQVNGWLTVQWIFHFPVVVGLYFLFPTTWESASLLYLALVSIYANVAGHLAAWQASRIEVDNATGSNLNDEDRQWIKDTLEQYKKGLS